MKLFCKSPPLPSANFQPGVRYHFSVYSCSSEGHELLQRQQGYVRELGKDSTAWGKLILPESEQAMTPEKSYTAINLLTLCSDCLWYSSLPSPLIQFSSFPFLATTGPSSSVLLSTSQQNSDVLLSWGEIPLINRRGFLLGYNVYIGSELKLLGKCYNVAVPVENLKKEFDTKQ